MTALTRGRLQRFVGCKACPRGCARRLCSVCAWWRRPRAQTCCTQRGAATPAKRTTGLTIRTARQNAFHKRRSTALTRLLTTTTQLLVSCGRELADFPARPASLLCPHLLAAPVRTGSLRIGWCTHARARRLALQQAPPAPPPPPVPLPPPPPEPPAPQSDSRASPKPPCHNQRRPSSQSRMPLSCVAASWSDSTNSAYKPYAVALAAFCTYNVYGCTDSLAANYQSVVPTAAGNQWAVNSEMCQYAGCNDTDARNFDSQVSGPHSAPALPSCSGRQCPHVKRQAPSRMAPRVRIHHWGEFGPAGRGGSLYAGLAVGGGAGTCADPTRSEMAGDLQRRNVRLRYCWLHGAQVPVPCAPDTRGEGGGGRGAQPPQP